MQVYVILHLVNSHYNISQSRERTVSCQLLRRNTGSNIINIDYHRRGMSFPRNQEGVVAPPRHPYFLTAMWVKPQEILISGNPLWLVSTGFTVW